MTRELTLPPDFPVVFADLKARVRAARHRAHRAANTEMLTLYWQIGDAIRTRQAAEGWGGKVIDRLAADLRAEFPAMTGLSRANLYSMRAFADAWPAEAIIQRAVGRLGWGQVVDLLTKLDDPEARDWYAAAADTGGWTRDVLANQIMNRTRERFGAAPFNFVGHLEGGRLRVAPAVRDGPGRVRLPRPERGRRGAGPRAGAHGPHGRHLARARHRIRVRGPPAALRRRRTEDRQVEPGYAGQLGFYVALVDDKLRNPDVHKPTVGLLMCRDRNETVVRYSLGATTSPVAVSTYTYDALPPEEQAALPSEADMVRALTSTTATAQANWNVSPTAGARVTQGESLTDEQ